MSSNSIFGNNPANISAQKFFIPQLLPQEVPASGSTLPLFGWFTQWANPTIQPVDEHAEPSLFWAPSGLPFQNPPIGWDVSWPNPTLPRPTTYSDPSLFWMPTNAPIQNPPIGWDEPWPNPTLAAVGPNVGSVVWEPQSPPNLPITPTQFGFYQFWPNPTLKSPSNDQGSVTWDPQNFSQVVIASPYGWFTGWDNPHIASGTRGESLFWMPTSAPIQNPPYGWYGAWEMQSATNETGQSILFFVSRPASPGQVARFIIWIQEDDA